MTAATATATLHDDPDDPRGILVRVPALPLTVRTPRCSSMYAEIDRALAAARPGSRMLSGFRLSGGELRAVVRIAPEPEPEPEPQP